MKLQTSEVPKYSDFCYAMKSTPVHGFGNAIPMGAVAHPGMLRLFNLKPSAGLAFAVACGLSAQSSEDVNHVSLRVCQPPSSDLEAPRVCKESFLWL